ncbi:MAG: hypothetical protein J0J04_08265 [Microbacterium sp.]|uniref:hypothetical protein n=1 Tax=Microbacterium sp. TaxID=51671 RepID=UPI001ACFD4FA|nr:hypothetical protein [Microbacterium sp.]MBN9214795.1 hypothetical protein [Microbacterium sp.]
MLISLLLSGLPVSLITIGGIIAAVSGLHLVVAVSGTKRPHDKAGTGLALGLAMMVVMWLWNDILATGFRTLSIDEDAALVVQESGNLLDDLLLSGQVAIITIVAVAIVTAVLAAVIGMIQRVTVSRPAPQPAPVDARPPAPERGAPDPQLPDPKTLR